MASPRLVPVALSDEERSVLTGWMSARAVRPGYRSRTQALAVRSRIVLRCAEGGSIGEIASELGVSRNTVSKWRGRFLLKGFAGLSDGPRRGRPRKIDAEAVELLLAQTFDEEPANGNPHWTSRSMAARTGLTQSAVSRIWRAAGLHPQAIGAWKLATDPWFVARVHDFVGLYLSPPENALVLAVDGKQSTQAAFTTRVPGLTGASNGSAPFSSVPIARARLSREYLGDEMTGLFANFPVSSASTIAQPYRRCRHQKFLEFLKLIDTVVPKHLDLYVFLVRGHDLTHGKPPVKSWLTENPRLRLYFTPTGGSWLNLVEWWCAELTQCATSRRPHTAVAQVEAEVRQWIQLWNSDAQALVWAKNADQIGDAQMPDDNELMTQDRELRDHGCT